MIYHIALTAEISVDRKISSIPLDNFGKPSYRAAKLLFNFFDKLSEMNEAKKYALKFF